MSPTSSIAGLVPTLAELDFLLAWGRLRWLVVLVLFAAAFFAHQRVSTTLKTLSESGRIRAQLFSLSLILLGILAVILALPDAEVRKDLLSLFGLLLSAMIALASSTFLGNVLAGTMVRSIDHLRPGDFVRVCGHFGRVTVRGLFALEIQTEERDLVTIPNLLLVNEPVHVIRSSGTVISAEVSLGYDVSRKDVEHVLLEAAEATGLEGPFVQVKSLGDYSVLYRIAGLQKDVSRLISATSDLREQMLDHLHTAGVEIVSPTFMNQRRIGKQDVYIAKESYGHRREAEVGAEDVAFDKADAASKLEELRKELAQLVEELAALGKVRDRSKDDLERTSLAHAKSWLEARIERLGREISEAEADVASIDAD